MNLRDTLEHLLSGNSLSESEAGELLRAIGLRDSRPDEWTEPARRGQRYVLSTDGLINAFGMGRLTAMLAEVRTLAPQQAADELVRMATQAPAVPPSMVDNVTVVIADVVAGSDLSRANSERGRTST